MPEDTKDVRPQGEQGAQEVPTPTISGSSTGESSARSGNDLDALAARLKEEIVKELPEMVDRRFKSSTDKRFHALDTLVEDFQTLKKYLDEAGGDEALAARNLKLDKIYETQVSGSDPGRSATQERQAGRPSEEAVTGVKEILKKYKLSYADPEVTQLSYREFSSEQEWVDAVEEIGKQRSKEVKQESIPGSALQSERGEFAGTSSVGELQAAYKKEAENIRPGDVDGLWALKEKYLKIAEEKGLDLPPG